MFDLRVKTMDAYGQPIILLLGPLDPATTKVHQVKVLVNEHRPLPHTYHQAFQLRDFANPSVVLKDARTLASYGLGEEDEAAGMGVMEEEEDPRLHDMLFVMPRRRRDHVGETACAKNVVCCDDRVSQEEYTALLDDLVYELDTGVSQGGKVGYPPLRPPRKSSLDEMYESRAEKASNRATRPKKTAAEVRIINDRKRAADKAASADEQEELLEWLRGELKRKQVGSSRLMSSMDEDRSGSATLKEFMNGLLMVHINVRRNVCVRVCVCVCVCVYVEACVCVQLAKSCMVSLPVCTVMCTVSAVQE